MTEKKRKDYTTEFKREAVRLVIDEGYKAAEAARSLDINGNMLGRWVREFRDASESAFPGKGNLSPEQEEISRLREENKRLRLEREILKKATAFFAKEGN
jgi:transposase